MMRLIFLFVLLSILPPAGAFAQDEPKPAGQSDNSSYPVPTFRDSVYYTMDDGVMSPEEMQMEADFVHEQCLLNPFQNTYFDCDCVGGAFLVQREKEGPIVPQHLLVNRIVNDRTATCANKPVIAGNMYESCLNYRRTYDELATDTPEYCRCVANKAANDFGKNPRLNIGYIEMIQGNAMNWCRDPQNRPENQRVDPANAPLGTPVKIPN